MMVPLGFRIDMGLVAICGLHTGVLTVKKLEVVPVSAIIWVGGPSSIYAVEAVIGGHTLLSRLGGVYANGFPRRQLFWRRRGRPAMMVLLPPCMLVTVASSR